LVGPQDGGRVLPATDALISASPGVALLLRFADCVPVLFYDPVRRAVGLAHAGWQGTLAGIAGKTARALQADLGCRASDLRAGIGPSIGPCCCEMGPEVLEQFRAAWPETDALCTPLGGGRALLDLWRLNALQLERAGVTQSETAGVCTVCNMHDYYSHRGENGATGRFGALIGLR
ncbi:MAG: polyphenol oxidase family protein, partial [Chloroflexi bacterium]|nr:polyphenol oxidase family protein [Chloroflexota bacterium]